MPNLNNIKNEITMYATAVPKSGCNKINIIGIEKVRTIIPKSIIFFFLSLLLVLLLYIVASLLRQIINPIFISSDG